MVFNIKGFGEESSKINYTGVIDWLVTYSDPVSQWTAHPTFVLCESIFLFGAFIMIIHAFKKGGRWPWLFFAAMGHGLVVELIAYFVSFIDNFWHAQGLITLFDRRMALYIAIVYPVFYYHSSWAASKMKLKNEFVECMAVGLLTVLIDMPYDMIGARYVHWIWHDTDPNIYDRHYWVPWNSYYFHLCFSTSFHFWFHYTFKWIEGPRNVEKWQAGSLKSEIVALLAASLLGMPGGCLLFIPLYHPMHDFFNVHSEITAVAIISIWAAVVWKFDRKTIRFVRPEKMDLISKILAIHLIGHYLLNIGTAIFFNPEDVVSVGLHQRIGNCNETEPVHTVLKTLQRGKYLCLDNYDEKYYDFHCLPNGKVPAPDSIWYTVCGTPFENRAEYIAILALISFIAYMVFSSIYCDYNESIANPSKKTKLLKKQH